VGNGPTEEDAEIIQHDQLSTHSEDAEEVRAGGAGFLSLPWAV
jgi:V-type H+-transporting ATPase subunit a